MYLLHVKGLYSRVYPSFGCLFIGSRFCCPWSRPHPQREPVSRPGLAVSGHWVLNAASQASHYVQELPFPLTPLTTGCTIQGPRHLQPPHHAGTPPTSVWVLSVHHPANCTGGCMPPQWSWRGCPTMATYQSDWLHAPVAMFWSPPPHTVHQFSPHVHTLATYRSALEEIVRLQTVHTT